VLPACRLRRVSRSNRGDAPRPTAPWSDPSRAPPALGGCWPRSR